MRLAVCKRDYLIPLVFEPHYELFVRDVMNLSGGLLDVPVLGFAPDGQTPAVSFRATSCLKNNPIGSPPSPILPNLHAIASC
jgi:hypothetical protein